MVEKYIIERCMNLAIDGHYGQVDKAGKPYIQHLLRVAGKVHPELMPIALLHDFFEDVYPVTHTIEVERYLPFLDSNSVYALWLLTRQPDMPYRKYIELIATSGFHPAIEVKLADIEDHLTYGSLPDSLKNRYGDAYYILKTPSHIHQLIR